MAEIAGTIEALWRYPIKSTGGERLQSVGVDARGVVGDRLYAVRDAEGGIGSGKTTRRFRRMDGLLQLSSRYVGTHGQPELLDARGEPVDIREFLGRDDVSIAREGEVSHFDQLAVSVLTTATLDWVRRAVPSVPVDERRFRPNILLRTPPGTRPFVEDDWFGRTGEFGAGPRLDFVRASERCLMTNQEQPGLPHSPLILKAIAAAHDNRLDALAVVVAPGVLSVGDPLVF